MSTLSTDKQLKAIHRVLDALDRRDARLHEHYSRQRNHSRSALRTTVQIYVPSEEPGEEKYHNYTVWTRNISPKGMGFIHPGLIKSENLLVCMESSSGEKSVFHAKIVRVNEVQDGFWEYGVLLLQRTNM